MSYVSDHALYGVGHYGSLGAVAYSTAVEMLQLQANRVARMKDSRSYPWPTVTQDGKIGPATLALAQKIQQSSPMTIDPIPNQAFLLANAKAYADVFKAMADSGGRTTGQAPPPVSMTASGAASMMPWSSGPLAWTSPQAAAAGAALSPAVAAAQASVPAATADKTASTASSYTPATQFKKTSKKSSSSFLTQSGLGFGIVQNWVVLAGVGVLALVLMRGRRSAPAPAAVVAPTVPKGV